MERKGRELRRYDAAACGSAVRTPTSACGAPAGDELLFRSSTIVATDEEGEDFDEFDDDYQDDVETGEVSEEPDSFDEDFDDDFDEDFEEVIDEELDNLPNEDDVPPPQNPPGHKKKPSGGRDTRDED